MEHYVLNLFRWISILIFIVLSLLVLNVCTVQNTKDCVHKETSKLRYHAIGSTQEIELNEPVVLVPNFRRFAWDGQKGLVVRYIG